MRAYYERLQKAALTGKQIVSLAQVQPHEPHREGLQRETTFPHTLAQDSFLQASTALAALFPGQENTLDLVKTHRQMLHDLLMLASTVLVLSPYARWPIGEE